MNKKLFGLSLIALALPLVGCNKIFNFDWLHKENTEQKHEEEDPPTPCEHVDANHDGECDLCSTAIGLAKAKKGTGALFYEALGYNSKDAAVIEEGDTRYVVYVSNESVQGEQVFAARKATKNAQGEFVYGDPKTVFKGAADSWDKNIFNPSIIKGAFTLGGTQYSYLMAYNGNTTTDNTNNHIGLAVSNDVLGEWTRVGDEPILENPEIYETAYGFGTPSLIYMGNGQGYLFASVGENECSYGIAKTFDFSNLDNAALDPGYISLPVTGLHDGQDVNVMVNAGYALSADGETLYLVKDKLPYSANSPSQSKAVTVAKAPMAKLGSIDMEWTVLKDIEQEDTMDDVVLGWDQIYSGEFVTDEAGKISSTTELEVVYSTFSEDGEMKTHSSVLASYKVALQ